MREGKKLTSHTVRQRRVGVYGVGDGGALDFFPYCYVRPLY